MFIRWIVIYPLDSAIHRLNNWGKNAAITTAHVIGSENKMHKKI